MCGARCGVRGARCGGARCGMRGGEVPITTLINEKGATAAPFFTAGEVGLTFLAGLLLPAFGFLRHCLLSPLSSWDVAARTLTSSRVAAAWHAHPMSALTTDSAAWCPASRARQPLHLLTAAFGHLGVA